LRWRRQCGLYFPGHCRSDNRGHPHAPSTIYGTPVSYDGNGNTLSYDVDGAGPLLPRSFTYDGENRPLAIAQNGNVTTMSYGPDGERTSKSFGAATT
jgi:hypothetical protein